MKQLVATLLVALSFNALAVPPVSVLITPSPLGVVIAVKSYLKDQKKVYYIRVESQAPDFEKAKKQAFRLASEQVAGTVVLSESELRNSKLTRDEIVTYSSGLIDEYKIVERYNGAGFVKLTMDVWITESVMAQRLLAKSATEKGIDGGALSTRAESILDERSRGDDIFRAVLRDFPRRAFRVKMETPDVYMDAYRNTQVSIPITISWDERFVNAFNDAAEKTGNKMCRFGCADLRYFIQDREFYDIQKLVDIDQYFRSSSPTVMVEVQNIYGQPVKRVCYLHNVEFYSYYGNSLRLQNGAHRFRASVNLGQDVAAMAKTDNILVEVVTNSQCRSL
jgi:hypothetical protein